MAIRTLSEKRVSDQMLERQMRNWEIARSQFHPTKREETQTQPVQDFLTISRSVGLPGDRLAQMLHERLGWPIYDQAILRAMAGDDACRAEIFGVLDERGENWVQSFVRGFMQPAFVSREAYFNRLVETVAALSRTAPGIFIGRGVDMILPKDVGLRIRLSASHDYCAERYAKDRGIHREAAGREIESIERERSQFVKQNFHMQPAESERFDLVINMEHVTLDETIDLILTLLRLRRVVP